jgi:hypothetical protein
VARDAVEQGLVPGDEDVFEVLSPVKGLVVVSQSCDIVRECSRSECVEVSPLIFVEDDRAFEDIRKGGGRVMPICRGWPTANWWRISKEQ